MIIPLVAREGVRRHYHILNLMQKEEMDFMSEKRLNNTIFLMYLVTESYRKNMVCPDRNTCSWIRNIKF